MALSAVVRILHFSDVHVDVPAARIPLADWFGKRLVGGANHALRRARHFRSSREKLAQLAQFAQAEGADLAVCTGDLTILGTEPELEAAAAAVAPFAERPLGLVAVPGNHDVYLPDSVREQRFEKHFGKYLGNEVPALAGPEGWPRVRLFGADVAVVTVRSARPNPAVWRSSGRIEDRELDALRAAVSDPRLEGRFVMIATHYAPRREDGTPDRWTHGLENADALLGVLSTVRWGCLVHGHIHRRFRLDMPGLRAPVLGAGSATQEGREGFWWIEVEGGEAYATPGFHDGRGYRLERNARALVGRAAGLG